jgi:hypothetical protein
MKPPPIALTALLLLCACNATTPQPGLEPPKIFELSFGGIGSAKLEASLYTRNSRLQPQTLEPRSDFTPNAISQSTFTHNGFRYLQATFQLQADGSPANYSLLGLVSSSSILGTAISSMKKYDGSNANPAIARQIAPLHAMQFDGVALGVHPEIAHFQIWAQSDLPVPPANSSLLNYGFVALTPQYNVTFAFKLPLQTSRSEDPFSFTMQFAGYSDTENRVTESLEEQGATSVVAARAASSGSTQVNLMPGSTFSTPSLTTRTICEVKTALAGTYNSVVYPAAFLFTPISTGCAS